MQLTEFGWWDHKLLVLIRREGFCAEGLCYARQCIRCGAFPNAMEKYPWSFNVCYGKGQTKTYVRAYFYDIDSVTFYSDYVLRSYEFNNETA